MQIQQLLQCLNELKAQWERDSKSSDLVGRVGTDWMKGVIYGITITLKEIQRFIREDNTGK